MTENPTDDYEQDFEGRFAWRRERWVHNLQELSQIVGPAKDIESLPGLIRNVSLVSDDPRDALGWSALYLWLEAQECYVFGQFQACVLACGAVIERCLKREYEQAKGSIPPGAKWTLGNMVEKCKGIVAPEIVELASRLLEPRNSRTHALLEHEHPQLAILGGPNRGIEVRGPSHYLIEPYRGDAATALEVTAKVLESLYGQRAG